MAVKVAINGFGRIGRLAFRQMTLLRVNMQKLKQFLQVKIQSQ